MTNSGRNSKKKSK